MTRAWAVTAAAILTCAVFSWATPARAGFIDFEGGADGLIIYSQIPGLEFTNTAGFDWLYADWRTNTYNGAYPNWAVRDQYPFETQYYSNGNFFAWLGTDQGNGKITFTQSYATYFELGYSVSSGITLTAYDQFGGVLDQDLGVTDNLGTGRLDTLRVDAPGMAYVIISGTGNQWLIDDISTDAIQECLIDANCDDHDYCTGIETCVNYQCVDGEPVVCEDDGLFCNGDEVCSNLSESCGHTGNPCPEGETCDEDADTCDGDDWMPDDDADETDDDASEDLVKDPPAAEKDDEAGWPEGKITGGCCGCGD